MFIACTGALARVKNCFRGETGTVRKIHRNGGLCRYFRHIHRNDSVKKTKPRNGRGFGVEANIQARFSNT